MRTKSSGQGKSANGKSMMLFSGRAFPALAEEIGDVLGIAPTPTDAYDFSNGELFVRYRESVRGSDAFVVQSMVEPVNKWLVESLIMVDALKRGSAKQITMVLPYYPYSRQDKKHRGREPISARLIADLYKTAGVDRILTIDLHTAQLQGFFDGPVDHLFAMDLLAEYVVSKYSDRPITVVAPDSGRVKVAERWGNKLGGCPLAFIHKTRDPLKPGHVVAKSVVGEIAGRHCLIVDDMIGTGSTVVKATDILLDAGAADVVVAVTHALMSDPATERIRNSKISEIVVTNTLPLPDNKQLDKITTLSIAPLIARAIQEVFDDGSVTTLFGGLS
ncbi:MAG: ribose-phosphate diphosphokinase [Micromonosporaceae bacterium]|nr:ribose-phosphate diphosphokinase [Micromonosporaceae bacterium]